MSPRRTSVSHAGASSGSPIADLIAEAVRAALAGTSTMPETATGRRPGRPRKSTASEAAPAAAPEGAIESAAHASSASAPQSPTGPTAVAEPKPAGPSLAAAKRAAEQELLDRVRDDLRAAYEGVPVTPDRLAFRLKVDRDLVDGALLVLVQRKEARSKWLRGRPAYTPFFSV